MNPCLSIVIARLNNSEETTFAVWVIDSPLPEGFTHHQITWDRELSKIWLAWQEMFSPEQQYSITGVESVVMTTEERNFLPNGTASYSAKLMQHFGISLWKWLWSGDIRRSLEQNQSFAQGRQSTLRIRLDIRDPDLIPIPWEIMLSSMAKPALSVNQQVFFSRTTTDVGILSIKKKIPDKLKILVVLGEKEQFSLRLEDAKVIRRIFASASPNTEIDVLLQPKTVEMIEALNRGDYNVFFYGGHGEKTADGGLLFLGNESTINGIELAQALVRNQVILALFNSCWSAQPEQEEGVLIERSSLSEVLLHYGVPAVLGMRDTLTDEEAITFIEAFSKAIASGVTIDEGVRVARQQLLSIYKFNQPAWTLPVLYMHPNFDGILLKPIQETTVLPSSPLAYLRQLDGQKNIWTINGMIRIGRHPNGRAGDANDVVITEPWVSSEHAIIIYRQDEQESKYLLKDISRYGTHVNLFGQWELFHHQDVPLVNGTRIRLGSIDGQTLEFLLEYPK